MFSVPHVVHVAPTVNNDILHAMPPVMNDVLVINDMVHHTTPPPSERLGFYDRMDDFQDQFNEMWK